MSMPVLFDVPGPKARARIRIGTVIGGLLIVGIIVLVLLRLAGNQQLDPQRWAILFDTRTGVPQTLLRALVTTLQAAAVGMVLATAGGMLLAVGRLSEHRPVRLVVGTWIEFFRAIPLLVLIFALFFLLPKYGLDLSAFQALVLGLALYNSAVLAEIFRAGILSIDKGQREAAYALGMRKTQVMALVLLPQAIRRMLPVLVAQLIVLLKDTSLGFIIGFAELLRESRGLVEFLSSRFGNTYTFQIYVAAGLIYVLVNVILSILARYVERRTRRNAKAGGQALELAPDTQMGQGGAVEPVGR
jgi:glutamate transport system permease protein